MVPLGLYQTASIEGESPKCRLGACTLCKIVKALLKHYSRPKNKKEIQIIEEIWIQVSQEQLQRLILNIPARMQAIIKAKDGST